MSTQLEKWAKSIAEEILADAMPASTLAAVLVKLREDTVLEMSKLTAAAIFSLSVEHQEQIQAEILELGQRAPSEVMVPKEDVPEELVRAYREGREAAQGRSKYDPQVPGLGVCPYSMGALGITEEEWDEETRKLYRMWISGYLETSRKS